MKIINSYRGGAVLPEPNTFIGGVGATSVTSIADFIALTSGITAANISNFVIDEFNNVSFFVDASYTLNSSAFFEDANITNYFDYDGKCTGIITNTFRVCSSIKIVALYGATSCQNDNFIANSGGWDVIYLPAMIPKIGGTASADEGNFSSQPIEDLFLHADIETNNTGSPDGDVQAASGAVNIVYIANTTSPSDITDLAVVTDAFGSALEFDWTAPSSSNAIDYYEIFAGGHFMGRTTSLNFTLSGLSLNTSYSITVNAIDIYYNRGGSNTIVLTTNATYNIPTGDIVSYYPLNTNSDDSVGTNDGTDTSMSYDSGGVVSNRGNFTSSTSSKIEIADDNSLSFGNGSIDTPFSYILWVKFLTNGSWVLIKKANKSTLNTDFEYQMSIGVGTLNFHCGDNTQSNRISVDISQSFITGVWYHLAFTYNGSGVESGINIYIDGVKGERTFVSAGSYTAMENETSPVIFGKNGDATTRSLNGYMDELALFDVELSQIQILEIKAKNDANLALTE